MSRLTISELRLRNYRAFLDARLVVDDVTFLVGRNGAGKSTLLDAFAFVSEAVTDSLETALERRGNFLGLFPKNLYHTPREGREGISLAVVFDREGEPPILYGFRIGTNRGYVVEKEVLRAEGVPFFERDGEEFHSSIGSLRPVFDPGTLAMPLLAGLNATWKKILEALRLISVHQLSPQAIRSEPRIGRNMPLSHDGENAGDVLKHLRPKDKKWIEERLAVAVPGVLHVSADAVGDRRVIGFVQGGVGRGGAEFRASQMSDGTLRSLGILLALRQSPRPSIVLLDEIEDSLHPLAHGVLLDAIDAASEEFPVVVSTHSPEILSHPVARPERVRIVQWDQGTSHIYQLGDGVRADLKPPLNVGRLLRANALWTDDEPSVTGDNNDFFKP
ncbi:MAG: AAA family ATPase [Isosphaeraceae bacterium]